MKAKRYYAVTSGPTFRWNKLELPYKRIPSYSRGWQTIPGHWEGDKWIKEQYNQLDTLQMSKSASGRIRHIKVRPEIEMQRFLAHQNIHFHFRLEKKTDNMTGSGYTEQKDEDLVRKHWPSLLPLLPWDDFSLDGPTHYLENAKYHWQNQYRVNLQVLGSIEGASYLSDRYHETDPVASFKKTCYWGCLPGDTEALKTTCPEDVTIFPADTMSFQDVGWWLVLRLEALKVEFARVMTEWGFLPLATDEKIEALKKRQADAWNWWYHQSPIPERTEENKARFDLLSSGYLNI